MFIDEADITIKGGNGGAGRVSFYANRSGPSGGNGGTGGSIYFIASSNMTDLKKYTQVRVYSAENGQPGGNNKREGHYGKNLILIVPIGTTIIDRETKKEVVLTDPEEKILLCLGGKGGLGNHAFKSSTNQIPKIAYPGEKGEIKQIKLVQKLIADFGLIGLPNAGKSSLLNLLTNANVKIASYPFTTLEPNLGVINGKIIADIPGLIEGASRGRGLGIRFLKHIEKVSLLFHCISVESENVEKDYLTVIEEIAKYNKNILLKKTVILLTKVDLISKEAVNKKAEVLKKYRYPILPVSIYQQEIINKLKQIII